jgi:hypothetical protein
MLCSSSSEPPDEVRAVRVQPQRGPVADGRRADAAHLTVVVTMGCGEACPVLPGPRYLDWPIADPAGRNLHAVRRIRLDIANHVLDLLKELL